VQANPKESKEKSLHFLGFLWRNRDFSTGYSGKNKKIPLRSNSLIGLCPDLSSVFVSPYSSDRLGPTPSILPAQRHIAHILDFEKRLYVKNRGPQRRPDFSPSTSPSASFLVGAENEMNVCRASDNDPGRHSMLAALAHQQIATKHDVALAEEHGRARRRAHLT
jgi:hypothetical protein